VSKREADFKRVANKEFSLYILAPLVIDGNVPKANAKKIPIQ
jgi:hypothetical protein